MCRGKLPPETFFLRLSGLSTEGAEIFDRHSDIPLLVFSSQSAGLDTFYWMLLIGWRPADGGDLWALLYLDQPALLNWGQTWTDDMELEEVKAHVQLTPDTSGFLLIHSSITTSVLHHVQRDGHWRADTSEENIFKYIQNLFCYCSCPRLYITLFHTLAASPKWRRADCHPISLHAVTLVMIRIKQRVVRRSGWSSLTNRSHIISVGHVTYKVNSYSYLLRLLVATWCLFWLNFSISVSAEQNPLGPG